MVQTLAPMGYVAGAATPDEMLGPDGQVRPHWQELAAKLAMLSPEDLERRNVRAQQYLRDSGVFYRQYVDGGADERIWPLSPVPVLVDEAEWDRLTPGLIQRATLLERLMADLYGPNRLVSEGHLPPGLIAGNPEWLRPMVGIQPSGGHFLHFLAFEIARGPDGDWWVLADRTQAPSGAGYALENRVATARAFSDLYAANTTHRLAGFFGGFRAALRDLAGGASENIAILTPGPMSETYYEQAWIARYLGLSLVQGDDLSVSRGGLQLRTVAGLQPLQVLWRRMDSSYADPIELDPASQLGTAGLVSALRAGGLTMVNALGSGVLETRALMAFLPALCRNLLGERLQLPNIATWWLGQASARAALVNAASERVLLPAISTGLPFELPPHQILPAGSSAAALAAQIGANGPDLVAQELVQLSTTPALVAGALVPRPLVLRVFLARTETGWQVMPGAFARIGASADPAAIAMQRGGATADVWVVSPHKQPVVTLANAAPSTPPRHVAGGLPARAADNLFWLGRYIERAESSLRLLRGLNIRQAENDEAGAGLIATALPLLQLQGGTLDQGVPSAVLDLLETALLTAGRVRDRFSPDAWQALVDLEKTARRLSLTVSPGDDAAQALSILLRKLAGISGLVHENMYRQLGWHFLTLGRSQERAMSMAAALAILADTETESGQDTGALELLVEFGDAVMTYRRRFDIAPNRAAVMDLLALDADNPRALRHQLDKMCEHVTHLPGGLVEGRPSDLLREVRRVQMALDAETPQSLSSARLWDLRGHIARISDMLTDICFR